MTDLYRHYDASGALLYVGISGNAIQRLIQHRSKSHWHGSIATMTIEKFSTRREAEDAETRAIRLERPKYNVMKVLDDTGALMPWEVVPVIASEVEAMRPVAAPDQTGLLPPGFLPPSALRNLPLEICIPSRARGADDGVRPLVAETGGATVTDMLESIRVLSKQLIAAEQRLGALHEFHAALLHAGARPEDLIADVLKRLHNEAGEHAGPILIAGPNDDEGDDD